MSVWEACTQGGCGGPDKPAGPIYITGNHKYYHHRLGKPKTPSKTIKATYNPPWTLPLFRRNEAMFNIKWDG